jgi:hypothetical protein
VQVGNPHRNVQADGCLGMNDAGGVTNPARRSGASICSNISRPLSKSSPTAPHVPASTNSCPGRSIRRRAEATPVSPHRLQCARLGSARCGAPAFLPSNPPFRVDFHRVRFDTLAERQVLLHSIALGQLGLFLTCLFRASMDLSHTPRRRGGWHERARRRWVDLRSSSSRGARCTRPSPAVGQCGTSGDRRDILRRLGCSGERP